ncbi:slowpoke-binding protein isoform X2 [Nasonia vitripennis]|uniref:Slowpoke-binding protein n=1 Tax=Nasonia vitripennis TaxID=7425 RepID=A0A7M7HC08_NASVI|nr:slowpoke-binding protein isoform X2 [Nasonia vitripennis]
MFTYYQNLNARREENELQREAESTGHDRFCQSRPGGVTTRRKRRGLTSRRTQSAIEIECNNDAFASVRSVLLSKEKSASIEEDESTPAAAAAAAVYSDEQLENNKGYYQLSSKIDSLAKLLFNRVHAVKAGYNRAENDAQRNNGRQQYTALEQQRLSNGAGGYSAESVEMEKRSRDRALSICRIYTRETPRYSLLKHLNNVGSRMDKHWFVVRDSLLKTERLLTLAPLNRNCQLSLGPSTRDVLNKLFLALQHPYVCPILDLEFVKHESQDYAVLVQPINQGSLKDIIYGIERNCWNEDWSQKYGSRGKGLPVSQIQRMGRQVLEALVFLKERDFPAVGAHLHSGNVIVQNGVARLAALENNLLGFTSRIHPIITGNNGCKKQSVDTVCFGHMLFEMTAGYELCTFEPTAENLSDIQKYPQVLECLRFIFERQILHGSRYPTLEELIFHDLFRNIDLRELRNASVNIFRPDTTIPISKILEGIKCSQQRETPVKRLSEIDAEDMISLSSPESERSENGSLLAQIYKELSITSV